jgi:Flp pilus assembly protein TadG
MPLRGRAMPDLSIAAPIVDRLGRFGANAKGLVAIEFAITSTMLVYGLLNAVDLGYYIYRRMEVENAAEAGAQAALKSCDQNSLPATQNCSGLTGAITSAIQNTSLGQAVTLASGYPTEGYYCTNSSNVLQYVSSVSSKPANCSAAGNASASPADYLQVQVTTTYQALFGVSVMGALGWTSISTTSWMRMG